MYSDNIYFKLLSPFSWVLQYTILTFTMLNCFLQKYEYNITWVSGCNTMTTNIKTNVTLHYQKIKGILFKRRTIVLWYIVWNVGNTWTSDPLCNESLSYFKGQQQALDASFQCGQFSAALNLLMDVHKALLLSTAWNNTRCKNVL